MQSIVQIGSFNMYKLSSEKNKDTSKNFVKIARIIADAGYDILALQEVMNERALNSVLDELYNKTSVRWDYYWERPKVGNMTRLAYNSLTETERSRLINVEEGYAFIWNPNRIRPVTYISETGEMKVFEPRIINQYHKEKYSVWSDIEQQTVVRLSKLQELVRNPLYGRFELISNGKKQGNFEIRLINAHIMFNRSKSTNIVNAIEKDNFLRRNEFRTLATAVLPKIAEKVYGNQMGNNPPVAYTFLMGDFNLNIKDFTKLNKAPYLEEEFTIYRGEDNGLIRISYISDNRERDRVEGLEPIRHIVTVQKSKSSLSDPISIKDNGNSEAIAQEIAKREKSRIEEGTYLANNYDHFTYDEKRMQGVEIEECDVYNPIANGDFSGPYGGDYRIYRKEVSDHLPIRMRIGVASKGGRL